MNYERLVDKGIDLLDRKRPGWENEIDLKSLDIVSGADCILGQLYGFFPNGIAKLNLTMNQVYAHGFDSELTGSAGFSIKRELTKMWTYKILVRRGMNQLLNQESTVTV